MDIGDLLSPMTAIALGIGGFAAIGACLILLCIAAAYGGYYPRQMAIRKVMYTTTVILYIAGVAGMATGLTSWWRETGPQGLTIFATVLLVAYALFPPVTAVALNKD